MRINLNADMGEGHGHYSIGDDAAILEIVQSVNVACGFHAGDATVMRNVCLNAKALGVSIGAHPGFNDLWGFGRRRIDMKPSDLEYMIAYQIGALEAMATYAGLKVTHVKPHGALNNMAAEDHAYARAIANAIKAVDDQIIYLALSNTEMERAGRDVGVPTAGEAFIDRQYEPDGNLRSRKHADAMIRDPDVAAKRTVEMVKSGVILAHDGTEIPTKFQSLCVHGDEPTAIAVARAVRDALEEAGVDLVPLPQMMTETATA